MGRANENVKKAKILGYKFTHNQLKAWNVKFDKLIFGKPSFDIFIDDKSFNFDKNWFKKNQNNLSFNVKIKVIKKFTNGNC